MKSLSFGFFCRLRGFTLVELLVTLAMVGIAATVVLPLARVVEARAKETELKHALRTIRQALDNYKAAADSGAIDKSTGSSGFPTSLAVLVSGVPRSASFGFSTTPLIFLRNIPRDPFCTDKALAAQDTWNIRAYGSQQGDYSPGTDVFDVSSKSDKKALDGSAYQDW